MTNKEFAEKNAEKRFWVSGILPSSRYARIVGYTDFGIIVEFERHSVEAWAYYQSGDSNHFVVDPKTIKEGWRLYYVKIENLKNI